MSKPGPKLTPTKVKVSQPHLDESSNLEITKEEMDPDHYEIKPENGENEPNFIPMTDKPVENIDFPTKAGNISVTPTLVESPNRIWVVEKDTQEVFFSMDFKIQSYAASIPPDESQIFPGNFCLGRIQEIDDRWYRCLITEQNPESVRVFSVDTGHTATIPRENIKKLPISLAQIPRQAFGIQLLGVKPAGHIINGTWSRVSTTILEDLLFRPYIQVFVDIQEEVGPGTFSGDIKCILNVNVNVFESRQKVADVAGYLVKKGVAFKQ